MSFRALPIEYPYDGAFLGYGSTGGRPWIARDLLIERDRGLYNTDLILDVGRIADRSARYVGPRDVIDPIIGDDQPMMPQVDDEGTPIYTITNGGLDPQSPRGSSAILPLVIGVAILMVVFGGKTK